MPEEAGHVPTNAVLYARAPSNAELLLFDGFVITPLAHNIVSPLPVVSSDTERLFGVDDADRGLINSLEQEGIVFIGRPESCVPVAWPNARSRPTPAPDSLEQEEVHAATLLRKM